MVGWFIGAAVFFAVLGCCGYSFQGNDNPTLDPFFIYGTFALAAFCVLAAVAAAIGSGRTVLEISDAGLLLTGRRRLAIAWDAIDRVTRHHDGERDLLVVYPARAADPPAADLYDPALRAIVFCDLTAIGIPGAKVDAALSRIGRR